MLLSDGEKLNNFILAVADGHAECLDAVYSLAGGRMFAVAISIAGKEYAEDIVHDSLIKIARFAYKYKQGDNPFGWITKIVKNTALDFLKAKKAHPVASAEEFYSLSSSDYSPDKRDDAIMLEQAIARLNGDEKKAIYLKYYLDLTVREIAKELKISKSAAARLIERAETRLKEFLDAGQNSGQNRF